MTQSKDKFYLGRVVDSEAPLLYDPDDLTTHGVVGMTPHFLVNLIITSFIVWEFVND
jgi:hypothetical protein